MINILILDDNIIFAINLLNYLNYKKEGIRICGVLKNEVQILKILNSDKKIDIILLNSDIGLGVLNKIAFDNRYVKSIIIRNYEIKDLNELRNNPLIYSGIPKDASVEEMYEKVDKLMKIKMIRKMKEKEREKEEKEKKEEGKEKEGKEKEEKQLKEQKEEKDEEINDIITEELLYLGYNIYRKGTRYLIETIKYMYKNKDKNIDMLQSKVYPIISKRNQDTVSNVKSNIIRTHNAWYKECEEEKLKKYFKLRKKEKPRIRALVHTVIKNVNKKVG